MSKPKNGRTDPKKSTNFALPSYAKRIAFVAFCICLVLQLAFDVFVFNWAAPGHDSSNQLIVTQISSAIQGLTQPAIVEPVTKKVYFPEANLVLPPYSSTVYGVLYGVSRTEQGSTQELNVTTTIAQYTSLAMIRNNSETGGRVWSSNLSHIFDQVPNAQACARGIHMVFKNEPYQGKFIASKPLADGRTVYMYNDAARCSTDLTPLANYLQQVESY